MPGRAITSEPGRIGPLAEWSVELNAIPVAGTETNPDTGVVNFSAGLQRKSHLSMNNPSTFTFRPRDPDVIDDYPLESTDTIGFGQGGFGAGSFGGYQEYLGPLTMIQGQSSIATQGAVVGRVDSVGTEGITASYTQTTPLSQFATGDIDIPAVTSGSPFAALDLCWQLAGNRRNVYTQGTTGDVPNGVFWSLQGHDAGFDRNGNLVTPVDMTTYTTKYRDAQGTLSDTSGADTVAVTDRQWNVKNNYTSSSWTSFGDGMYSNAGTGSSLSVTPGNSSLIVFTIALRGGPVVINFGDANNPGFGPDQALTSTGKWMRWTIDPSAKTATWTGALRSGGTYNNYGNTTFSFPNVLTTGVTWRVAIESRFTKTGTYETAISVADSQNNANVGIITNLATSVDKWSRPWTHTGPIRSLFTYEAPTGQVDIGNFTRQAYENPMPAYQNGSSFFIQPNAPIMPFTGALWDYLCQVNVARQTDLLFDSNGLMAVITRARTAEAVAWNPVQSPSFNIGLDNIAPYIEVEQYTANNIKNPVIYDALKTQDDFSFAPGSTTIFTVDSNSIGDFLYAPEPLDDLGGYLDTPNHPYGGYVVSGGDNLNIMAAQWVAYGGSVTVKRLGPTQLQVTVVAATIPGIDGDYYLGVSDGETSYPCLRIIGQYGSTVDTVTKRFETGAEPKWALSASGQSIQNCAATNSAVVNTLALFASSVASGPSLSLTGSFPLRDIEQWPSKDMLLIPGQSILYHNLQWRVFSVSITDIEVQFSAQAYNPYGNGYWNRNWVGKTNTDFKLFWEGKTYDDFKTEVLLGPDFEWEPQGAVRRWTLYPSPGGIATNSTGGTTAPTTTVTNGSLFPTTTTWPAKTYPGLTMRPGSVPLPDNAPQYPGGGSTSSVGGGSTGGDNLATNYVAVYPSPDLAPGNQEDNFDY